MKNISTLVNQKVEEKLPDHEYEHWVGLTAGMLKRPYFVVHKIVQKWSVEKIRRRYIQASKHSGDMPSNVWWWWIRKQEK